MTNQLHAPPPPDEVQIPLPRDPAERYRDQGRVNDALYELKVALMAQAEHGLAAVNEQLRLAGIDHPQGAAGVKDLAFQRDTACAGLIEAMEDELERMKALGGIHAEFLTGMGSMLGFAQGYTSR